MVGRATLMMVKSTMVMKKATTSRANARQRRVSNSLGQRVCTRAEPPVGGQGRQIALTVVDECLRNAEQGHATPP